MVIINREESKIEECVFYTNGMLEMMVFIHAMTEAAPHPSYEKIVRSTYESLSHELKTEIDYFADKYSGWLFIADIFCHIIIENHGKISNEEMLNGFVNMSEEEFAYYFLGLPAFNFDKDEVECWIRDPDSVTESDLREQAGFFDINDVRLFLKDIKGFKNRLVKVLRNFWDEVFSPIWEKIEAFEAEMLAKEKLAFSHDDAVHYLSTFNSKIKVEDNRVIFQKDPDFSIGIDEIRRMYIGVSVFSMPHLLGNISGDTVNIMINYDFRSVDLSRSIGEETFNLIGVLNDRTRLKVIRLLWDNDATTKEIAELLELSQSTISLHLKEMKETGLVDTNKVKKYVFYHLNKEPFFNLQQPLIDYFNG